jgi:hypothetical protein
MLSSTIKRRLFSSNALILEFTIDLIQKSTRAKGAIFYILLTSNYLSVLLQQSKSEFVPKTGSQFLIVANTLNRK